MKVNHVFHGNGEPIRWARRSWTSACIQAGLGQEIGEVDVLDGAGQVVKRGPLVRTVALRLPHDYRRPAARNLSRELREPGLRWSRNWPAHRGSETGEGHGPAATPPLSLSQSGGRRFDPGAVHQLTKTASRWGKPGVSSERQRESLVRGPSFRCSGRAGPFASLEDHFLPRCYPR